jgi:anti-sigma B factor antagonist
MTTAFALLPHQKSPSNVWRRGQSAGQAFRLGLHRPSPGVLVIGVTGDLDLATAPQLEAALLGARVRDARAVVVDLSDLGFLGVSGIAVLLTARRVLSRADGSLWLVTATPGVPRLLATLGLDGLFDIRADLGEALESVAAFLPGAGEEPR